jgi:hypothetical protein
MDEGRDLGRKGNEGGEIVGTEMKRRKRGRAEEEEVEGA